MKKKLTKPAQRALDKAARLALEQNTRIVEARIEERNAHQRNVDRQFMTDFFRTVDAAVELPDSAVMTAGIYINGGYRDLKFPMASLRRLAGATRRLLP